MSTYNDNSIELLTGAERVRKRVAVMLGTNDLNGALHCIEEILGNSFDEGESGYGDELEVHLYNDNSISVRDYGRGVPLGWNEKVGNWNWHNVYNELYGGGKYAENQNILKSITDWSTFDPKSINYLFSVGLNGLGGASTQYTSEFFTVKSYRDGKVTTMNFKKGYPIINGEPVDMFATDLGDLKQYAPLVEDTTEPNGTYIHWRPDKEIFIETQIPSEWVKETCRNSADVTGLRIHFISDVTGEDIVYDAHNLEHLIEDNCQNNIIETSQGTKAINSISTLAHGTVKQNNENSVWVCKADISIAYTKSYARNVCFHNNIKMGGGQQYLALDVAVADFFTELTKQTGIKLDSRDYEGVFTFIVSSYSNIADYRGQTKDEVGNQFVFDTIYDMVITHLRQEYGKGTPEITEALQRVIKEAQARIQIKELSKQIREHNKILKQEKPEKFTPCRAYDEKNPSIAELWITEGDSAKSSVKKARDKNFQAIFPIRGKILNVLKSSLDRILKNQEISGIFGILGTGMDFGTKDIENTFDIDKLRFDKVIIATDADEDGAQIRVLLFLIFYKLAPELLRRGHIYIAPTPKFSLKYDTGTLFALDDAEKEKLIAENGMPRVISRFKGLGEMPAEILRETTVNPETRYPLIQLKVDCNDEVARRYIDVLFGEDKFHERKSFLANILGISSDVIEDEDAFIMNLEEQEEDEDMEEQVV